MTQKFSKITQNFGIEAKNVGIDARNFEIDAKNFEILAIKNLAMNGKISKRRKNVTNNAKMALSISTLFSHW